jgi:acyl-[acyl-carrier-protein]-phospholipid O-acyltransferase/long-chain-fatty-acid--[acyl-carrier-protein] ligase
MDHMRLLNQLRQRIPFLSKGKTHGLLFLNIAQSLGAINDNLFKFAIAFLLIDTLGTQDASSILSAIGAIYVIPFLLFSSAAGILADRFSKQKLLVLMKVAEAFIMIVALFAFGVKSVFICYLLLFLLAIHSALFGPSKYGIIRELVPSDRVSKANGLVTSFTYLSMIIGTFLASFLTEITDRNFVVIACVCLVIALAGLCGALGLPKTIPQGSDKKLSPLFISEIFKTLKGTRASLHLLPAICGSSFFLFLGAFVQLNMIPFSIKSLHLSEVDGGYLFLVTALGIALGAYLGGKASKRKIELGLPCLAGVGLALCFGLLAFFASHLIFILMALFLLGLVGGAFVVPFDTFIQVRSENEKRGQTIGATNFLSFSGVLIASLLLYVLNDLCGLSPAESFGVVGLLTFAVSLVFMCLLSDLFLPFLSKTLLSRFLRLTTPEVKELREKGTGILILEQFSWKEALLIAGQFAQVNFVIATKGGYHRRFHRLFASIYCVKDKGSNLWQFAESLASKGFISIVLSENTEGHKLSRGPSPRIPCWVMKAYRDRNKAPVHFDLEKLR